jgi:hypothetical protein
MAGIGVMRWVRGVPGVRTLARWWNRRRRVQSVRSGRPEDLPADRLAAVTEEVFGFVPVRCRRQKLSSWKRTGAFRLQVQGADGGSASLVYKDADYAQEEIPALEGLPVLPGIPEYVLYSGADGALLRYLPRVYWIEEVVPGRHYRYLLEDLSAGRRPSADAESLLECAARLLVLHRELAAWYGRARRPGLLLYGREFSLMLQPYIERNLRRYAAWSREPLAEELCRAWPEISILHRSAVFWAAGTLTPIHGDFNASNIWIGGEGQMRVVDWEWLGLGLPYQDLVSLLKRAPRELEERALQVYAQGDDSRSADDHRRLYQWCKLERAILDAAFLAVQAMQSRWRTGMDHAEQIRRACRRGLAAFRLLV